MIKTEERVNYPHHTPGESGNKEFTNAMNITSVTALFQAETSKKYEVDPDNELTK